MKPFALLRCLTLCLLAVLLPRVAAAAGFDCDKAAAGVEQAVCADDALSLDDFVLAERYRFLASHCAAMPGASARVQEQRRWVAQVRRDFVPGDDGLEALRASYHQRNVELERDLAACTLTRREFPPLRIATAANASSAIKLPWVEAASPEVSRRIDDAILGRVLDARAPARLADVVAMLPSSERTENDIYAAEFEVHRNDGRLLVIVVKAEGCFKHCEESFTARFQFDARTGRPLAPDVLFTERGSEALTRYFAHARVAKARALIAGIKRSHEAEPDEIESYEDCLRGWTKDVALPEPELGAAGQWVLPAGSCNSGYARLWDALEGIEIPLPASLLERHLSAYGRSLLLGKGSVLDPAPPPPRCVRPVPFEPPVSSPIRSLAFGVGHRVALMVDGSVVTWGEDDEGQLGRGERRGDNQPMPPQTIATGMAAVAAGHGWSAAVGDDGTLWTWGSNYLGTLGHETTERGTSRPVAIGRDYVQVRADEFRGLALRRDGSLWAWGDREPRPHDLGTVPRKLGDGFAHIEIGSHGEFQALDRDGALWTWGGTTSDGTHLPEDTPRKLGEGFARLAGHGLQAAYKTDGSLWAWGLSLAAMIPTDGEHDRPPQRIGDGFEQVVSAPNDAVAALKTDGSLWLARTRGGVSQLEAVGCGYRGVALVGADWEIETAMHVQVVALRDDGALVTWPARPASGNEGDVASPTRPSVAAPLALGRGWRQLEAIDGQWSDHGPELLAVDEAGRVWERRDLHGSSSSVAPTGWMQLVELPKAPSKP